jgi:hypothetical protein
MTKTRHLFAGITVALAAWLAAGAAYAQNAHSWVSQTTGTGTACTRTAPCATFFDAQSATAAGGVISVPDPGDSNAVMAITKSLISGPRASMAARRPPDLVGLGFLSMPAQPTWSRWKGCTSAAAASSSIPEASCRSSDASSPMTRFPLESELSFSRTAPAS